jgi:molybdopterin molybdotransferase
MPGFWTSPARFPITAGMLESPGRSGESRGAPGALMPVAAALSRLIDGVRPVAPRSVQLRAAEGRVLAEPLRARGAVPPISIALRDGWALAAEEVVGASSYSPAFLPDRPIWVAAGQAVPPGADCVMLPGTVSAPSGMVEVTASAPPGEGVRRAGEDATPGAVLRQAGEVMRAIDVAAATAAGLDRCVVREARVRVLSVGSKPGAVTDLLQRHVVLAGAQVVHQSVSERSRVSALGATPAPDLILMAGDTGLALEILSRNGAVLAGGLALRPGEGSACGRVGETPAIVVPPRLEAALALYLLLIDPCLDRLSGANPRPDGLEDRLTRKIASGLGVTELALLRETSAGFEPLAVGDLSLPAMGAADHWLAVPAESEGYPAGELVEARPL